MVNPFVFDRPLAPDEGADVPLVDTLVDRLQSPGPVVLVGAPRWGKSTMLLRVERKLGDRGLATRQLDLARSPVADVEAALTDPARAALILDNLHAARPEVKELLRAVDGKTALLAATVADEQLLEGDRIELKPVAADRLRALVMDAFASGGHDADSQIDALLGLTGAHPQRTQQLAHDLWQEVLQGRPPQHAWETTLRRTRASLDNGFQTLWERHGETDRRVLEALVASDAPLFSRETIEQFGLSKSGASRARDRLIHEGILRAVGKGRHQVADPLYADWIRRKDVDRERPTPVVRSGVAPFGDPDGARAELADIMADYVPLQLLRGHGSDAAITKTARVVAGRKGSGKTLFLRRLQAAAKADPSVYAEVVSADTPMTSEIVRFASTRPQHLIVESWNMVWRSSILLAVASHVLHGYRLAQYLSPEDRFSLEDLRRRLGAQSSFPHSIGAELRGILTRWTSQRSLDDALARWEWTELAYLLGSVVRDFPPMFFFLDALDDEFRYAPRQWLECQVGLINAVMRLMRDPLLGGRVHVAVSVRDVALSSILRSEHGTRFAGDPRIEALFWDERMIRRFLREKVRRLPGGHDTVADWLGVDRVRDSSGTDVDIDTYLIQHTRLLPRDITALGNALYVTAAGAHERDERVTEADIRHITATRARSMGIEELAIVGGELAAEMMPRDAPLHAYAELYTDPYESEPLAEGLAKAVTHALRQLGTATPDEAALRELASGLELEGSDVLSSLWQHRLLGFREDGRDVYRTADLDDLTMPEGRQMYVLHPVLRAALA